MNFAAHIPNIRRVYHRPWQDGRPANPGKIATCVQVGVRPETTLIALESMLHSPAKALATRAGLAAVGRFDVDDLDTDRMSLVLDEALQLPKGPAMEPRAHAPARADVIANVREIFQHDSSCSRFYSRGDNGPARFVINVPHAPPLPAGDLPELLFRALAAVGLKTATQGKVTVAPVAQRLAAKDLARTDGGERIFPNIHTHRRPGCQCSRRICRFYDQIEVPLSTAENQLGFLCYAGRENVALVRPEPHSNGDTALESVERDLFLQKSVSPFVEMNARLRESDWPYGFTLLRGAGVLPGAVTRISHHSLNMARPQVGR